MPDQLIPVSPIQEPDPDSRRGLIALISDELGASQKPLLGCLSRHLSRAGYGLIDICGGPLKPSPNLDGQRLVVRNAIYPLTRRMPVDGFIVLTSTIGKHADSRELAHFVRQFAHRPLVCLGSAVPNVASVSIDHHALMLRLMDHLTENEQRRRFVFLRGCPDSPHSHTLELAFREALSQRRIPIDEALVLDGNGHTGDASLVMDKLLSLTREIDAVVAADDEMARIAIHALSRHGLRVPEHAIVSGFHDTLAATASLPAITTVGCSSDSLATLTTASLVSQIESGELERSKRLIMHPPAGLIIRASTEPALDVGTRAEHSPVFDVTLFRSSLLQVMSNLAPSPQRGVEAIVDDVLSMLVNDVPFSGSCLETALQGLHERPDELYWWRHLHRQITAGLERHGSEGQSRQAISRAARILGRIHESIWLIESAINLGNEQYREATQQFRANLLQVMTLQDLISEMERISEHCDSRFTFICVYDIISAQPDEQASVVFQRPSNVLGDVSLNGFASRDILPGEFLRSGFAGPLAMEPLCVGSTHLGYLILDMSNEQYRTRADMSALCDYIANALYRIFTRP